MTESDPDDLLTEWRISIQKIYTIYRDKPESIIMVIL